MKKLVWILLLVLPIVTFGQVSIVPSKTSTCLLNLVTGTVRTENISYTLSNCINCTNMEWDVGNGFLATGAPVYVTAYDAPGLKNVKCTYTTASGSINTITLNNAIRVHPIIKINVAISDTTLCLANDSALIEDLTPNIKTRQWLLNGLNLNPGPKKVKLNFRANSSLKLFLAVTDSFGCVNNYLKDSAILIGDTIKGKIIPSAKVGCAPKAITFELKLDSFKQGIVKYDWVFQNGLPTISTIAKPTNIVITKPDTSDVTLHIVTTLGCKASFFNNNLINLGDSSTLKLIVNSTKVCANAPLEVECLNAKTKLTWEIKKVANVIDSTPLNKLYFRVLDTGKVDVKVSQLLNGCVSTTTVKNLIEIKGPKAFYTANSTQYCSTPDTIVLTNTSILPLGAVSWKWDIFEQGVGNVASATSKNFSYIVTKFAKYNIRLIATGANGCIDTINTINAITGGLLKAAFISKPKPVCPGQFVTLADSSFNKRTGIKYTYNWTFYSSVGAVLKKSVLENPTNTYTTDGLYDARLVLENSKGCKDSIRINKIISVQKPIVTFQVDDSLLCRFQKATLIAFRNPKSKSAFGKWEFENIDSVTNKVFINGDTAGFSTAIPGKWKVKYTVTDTSGNGCTIVYLFPNLIKISGVVYSITSNNSYGCIPLATQFRAALWKNFEYENYTNSPITWKWKSSGKVGNYSLNSPSLQITNGTANVKGVYFIRLNSTNGSGCQDSSGLIQIYGGVRGSYVINSPNRCSGIEFGTTNTSYNWATSFEWICDSSSVIFKPDKFAKQPSIKFTKPGIFYVYLISKYQNCSDTFLSIERSEKVTADFTTDDTILFCAPKAVNFKNTTTGFPFNNWWSFGNGTPGFSKNNASIGALYTKNKPLPGYDIQLISQNRSGCRDTMLKKGYLKIIGPVPDFSIFNKTGCEPLNVNFVNKSGYYSKFFLDYGDGSFLDSSKFKDHLYRTQSSSLLKQRFIPSLLLYDNNNCAALAVSEDTIEVNKSPDASFTFNSLRFLKPNVFIGCADDRFLVNFVNTSKFYIQSDWDLDGDGTLDVLGINNPSNFYKQAGNYVPVLVATFINGCKDTFSKDTIIALEAPVADFVPITDSICLNEPAFFLDKSISAFPITKYKWNFGEQDFFDDTSHLLNPSYTFHTMFEKYVRLNIMDINGCKAEVIKVFNVLDTFGPVIPIITYATVNEDNSISFNWLQSKDPSFGSYALYKENPNQFLKINNSLLDTSNKVTTGINVNTNRYCFNLKALDTCGYFSKAAFAHCTILLNTTSTQLYHNQLSWLAYDYWGNQLDYYEIYRKLPTDTGYIKIADVKSIVQSYTDSFLCDKLYCYYVKALHKNRKYFSKSNISCSKPLYAPPALAVPIHLVTVNNNQQVDLNWAAYPQQIRGGKYSVERGATGTNAYFPINITPNLNFTDITAEFKKKSFTYRIKFQDHCGKLGPASFPSNSINLNSPQVSGIIDLNWTPYKLWYAGVKEYILQFQNRSGAFVDFTRTTGAITSVSGINIGNFDEDSVCFRVIAIKDTSDLVYSYSNYACYIDQSTLIVPTAFSPNKNNLNDLFKVNARNIIGSHPNKEYRFSCSIYNRWGQKVYEILDPNQGWDGKFNGEDVPAGIYIVKLYAVGFDGILFKYNGALSIFR